MSEMLSPLRRTWPACASVYRDKRHGCEARLLTKFPSLFRRVLLSQLNLHRVVDYEVHEFVKALHPSAIRHIERDAGIRTLSLPSIRRPRFSYSHIETFARAWRSLNMKLIGGRSTVTR
jgi:hypothetical protein